jgi:hypothetical protein
MISLDCRRKAAILPHFRPISLRKSEAQNQRSAPRRMRGALTPEKHRALGKAGRFPRENVCKREECHLCGGMLQFPALKLLLLEVRLLRRAATIWPPPAEKDLRWGEDVLRESCSCVLCTSR